MNATLFEPFSLVRRSNQLKACNFNDLGARKESFENWLPSFDGARTFSRNFSSFVQRAGRTAAHRPEYALRVCV